MTSPVETLASNTLEKPDVITQFVDSATGSVAGTGLESIVVAGLVALIVLAALASVMPFFVYGIYRRANEINRQTRRLLNEVQSLNLSPSRNMLPCADKSDPSFTPSVAGYEQEPFLVDRDPGEPMPGSWKSEA